MRRRSRRRTPRRTGQADPARSYCRQLHLGRPGTGPTAGDLVEAFEFEYRAGRALDVARVAHEAARRMQAAREVQPARALSSERDAAVPLEAMTVLTPREIDVLKLVAQGLSNPDIARTLVLSDHTIHRHLANILRKLNLSSRAAAAAWGVRAGLI